MAPEWGAGLDRAGSCGASGCSGQSWRLREGRGGDAGDGAGAAIPERCLRPGPRGSPRGLRCGVPAGAGETLATVPRWP